MTGRSPSVLGVGTVALDSVETPSDKVVDVPGGSALYFGAAARFFGPVAVAGVVGEDFPEAPLASLEGCGVDVSAIHREPGETFRWKVRYGEELTDRETLETNRGVTLQRSPSVPAALRSPRAVFLGSTNPSVQREVLEQLAEPGLVVLDTMTHWVADRRDDLVSMLDRVHVILVNEEEAGKLGESVAPPIAARNIQAMGPAWVVIKRGAKSVVAFGPGVDVSVPARVEGSVVDPTGAGDAFAGGFVGCLASGGEPGAPEAGTLALNAGVVRQALSAGAATAALAIAAFSFGGLMDAEATEVLAAL